MSDTTRLKKTIKIYWYIIGFLSLFIVYNHFQDQTNRYADPKRSSTVRIADNNDNFIRMINFFVREDSTILYNYNTYANWIYTNDDDISLKDYSFNSRGSFEYYAIDEGTIYYVRIPNQIKEELKNVFIKRKRAQKEVLYTFVIHPQGLIELQVDEVGIDGDYYKNGIPLYQTTFRADGYSQHHILQELAEELKINYSEQLPQLLKSKYNWCVRFSGTDVLRYREGDKIKGDVEGRNITYNSLNSSTLYGVQEHSHSTKFYLERLELGRLHILFDIPTMNAAFKQLYADSDPSERSYIFVKFNDRNEIEDICLLKDKHEVQLSYQLTGY